MSSTDSVFEYGCLSPSQVCITGTQSISSGVPVPATGGGAKGGAVPHLAFWQDLETW